MGLPVYAALSSSSMFFLFCWCTSTHIRDVGTFNGHQHQLTCMIQSEMATFVAQNTVESRERPVNCRSCDWQQQQLPKCIWECGIHSVYCDDVAIDITFFRWQITIQPSDKLPFALEFLWRCSLNLCNVEVLCWNCANCNYWHHHRSTFPSYNLLDELICSVFPIPTVTISHMYPSISQLWQSCSTSVSTASELKSWCPWCFDKCHYPHWCRDICFFCLKSLAKAGKWLNYVLEYANQVQGLHILLLY